MVVLAVIGGGIAYGASYAIGVPPGNVPVTQQIAFSGRPSDSATSLTLTCNTLFWQGFGQPRSLQVKGIELTESGSAAGAAARTGRPPTSTVS